MKKMSYNNDNKFPLNYPINSNRSSFYPVNYENINSSNSSAFYSQSTHYNVDPNNQYYLTLPTYEKSSYYVHESDKNVNNVQYMLNKPIGVHYSNNNNNLCTLPKTDQRMIVLNQQPINYIPTNYTNASNSMSVNMYKGYTNVMDSNHLPQNTTIFPNQGNVAPISYPYSFTGSSQDTHYHGENYSTNFQKINYSADLLANNLNSLQVNDCDMITGSSSGLMNLGNTCYMNSILQCLANTTELNRYCVTQKYKEELKSKSKTPLFVYFAEIIKDMSSSQQKVVSPYNFKKKLFASTKFFDDNMQCDAQEFLTFTLQLLGEEVLLRRKKMLTVKFTSLDACENQARKAWKEFLNKENNIIIDLFMGQMSSKLTFVPCGHDSVIFEPTLGLSLPVPVGNQPVTLMDCLNLYFKKEHLHGENRITCESCNKKLEATKYSQILKMPRILILHLKRFKSMSNGKLKKNENFVNIPLTNFNMKEFAYNSSLEDILYDLYAIVNHFGTPSKGHYTAYILSRNTWINADDEELSRVPNNIPTFGNAYILFYKLVTRKLQAEDTSK